MSIVTREGADYFVKLVSDATGKEELVAYIHGGDTLEITMPLGIYELRYASGEVWYGEEFLFGPRTSYSRADTPFNFEIQGDQVAGYTVELFMRAGGNLDVDPISASEF
ncbi:MAG: hypothetical protein JNJ73_15175 [Hyphomonadaceae bacterium]|nr:hypothetical protein [Hyphomonadaceae bacterium]